MKTGYVGIHTYDIPLENDPRVGLRWNYTLQQFYHPILALVKASVLTFLLRLGGTKQNIRWVIYVLHAFNLAQVIAVCLACIFQCTPVSYFWDPTVPGGTCFNKGVFYITSTAITIFTDILVLALPFWIFLGLNMPARVKIALMFVFLLGGM